MQENTQENWRALLPRPQADGHKYNRGHAVVLGGPVANAGAAKMAARAALRIGAGVVSVATRPSALLAYAMSLQAVMTKVVADEEAFAALVGEVHVRAVLLGPGAGLTGWTKQSVRAGLATGKACVLDADALSVFADEPDSLFAALHAEAILTPHGGEFLRLFPAGTSAEMAARQSGAVVVLKGNETQIAAPDGRVAVNRHATPYLATAGSGDVLAGMITGLRAQGMPAFEAACAAVWMHGEAGRRFGPGLIAEDIEALLPAILRDLLA